MIVIAIIEITKDPTATIPTTEPPRGDETQGATATIGGTMIEGAAAETRVAGDHRIGTTMIIIVVMIYIVIATAGTAWIASDFLLIPTTTATIETTIATIEAACLLRLLVRP